MRELSTSLIIIACVLGFPTLVLGDLCADCNVQVGTGTPSDHVNHAGYACTYTVSAESTEDFDDVKSTVELWNENDINCGCSKASPTYSQTKNRTNKNWADLNVSGSVGVNLETGGGVSLAGLVKVEGSTTATWSSSLGWGYHSEDNEREEFEAQTGFKAERCSEWWYKKYVYEGNVGGTAHLDIWWEDDSGHEGWQCCGDGAITATGLGYKPYTGTYPDPGEGFQNEDVRCTKCDSDGFCFLGTGSCCDLEACPE